MGEAPKFEAIKNDPSLPPMQKMKQLHAIHAESAPQLQKILSPAQYQQLQAIRETLSVSLTFSVRLLGARRCRAARGLSEGQDDNGQATVGLPWVAAAVPTF